MADLSSPRTIADQPVLARAGASIEPRTMAARMIFPESAKVEARVRTNGHLFKRGTERLKIRGVTYGPFSPNTLQEPLPEEAVVFGDFSRMRSAGVNAVRIYTPPPGWFLDAAEEQGLLVLNEVPCPKHLDFLESSTTRREARERVRRAVSATAGRSCLLGCCIGNEISSDIIRWYGPRKIERFLSELADTAREVDPEVLLTYASYPPTEYLQLPFLDFVTFNVYLHDPDTFRRYLLRLANLHCNKPLVLGEIGMDTFRNGETKQAEFISSHLCEAAVAGIAGSFVFSWTDDWFTHGFQVEDWAFGMTRRDRSPKASFRAMSDVYTRSPAALLARTPKVSIVVCSYNGGRTLEECLKSLQALDYPDYEVILVDDGSTDNTPEIAARFPSVRTIRQLNQGLSAARNTGLAAATGDVVAYTDSDCFADPDWIALLVHHMEATGAGAVGGPNLTPEDGWLAECVAAAPGQPTHVLESDEIAEHIPGCNMAFRREALLSIGGFDPTFRKAGDDVDACWGMQAAGYRISFAPGAFVWHHRRQGPKAYLKQQAGYGEAEALLAQKHPERYSIFGGSIWRGVVYGGAFSGLRFGRDRVNRGLFGKALFQTLYKSSPSHWAMLPATLEWQVLTVLMGLGALHGFPAWNEFLFMACATLVVTFLQAIQAQPGPRARGLAGRCVIAMLCWLQPLVRSFQRYRTRFIAPEPKLPAATTHKKWPGPLKRYITMEGIDRATFLGRVVEELRRRGHHPLIDPGWSRWDIKILCNQGVRLKVRTVQEFYGGNSAQVAIRYQLRGGTMLNLLPIMAIIVLLLIPRARESNLHEAEVFGYTIAAMLLGSWIWLWHHGRVLAIKAASIIDATARKLGMIPFDPDRPPPKETP